MELTKEKILTDILSGLSEEKLDAIQDFENDPAVQKLKAQQAELMRLMKPYSDIRRDTYYDYGVCERRPVSQKEKKKKKAKRRMVKKSKR